MTKPNNIDPLDEIIEGLVAAKLAAIQTAQSELPDAFENSEIVESANRLLDRYKAQAKASIELLMLQERLEAAKHIKEICPITEGASVERLHGRIDAYVAELSQLTPKEN